MSDTIIKTIYNGAELLNMKVSKLPTLIEPILPKVGVVALIGTSDIGKSTLLLQLCSDIALNETFLQFPIEAEHRSTIYVSTEDDRFSIAHRLQVLQGKDEEGLKKMRFVFNTERLLERLEAALEEQKADLVAIDTFTDIYTGEMNQVNKVRSYMNDFFNLAQKHECLVIFNHHTGKYTEEKPPSKNNSIGSAGFEGKCRLVLELRPDYKDDSKRHLCIVKGNYLGPEYKSSSYELTFDQERGFQRTGVRKSFDLLVKPKLFKPVAGREVEKGLVLRLHQKGRSCRRIEQIMKRLNYTLGKTTIAEWMKDCPSGEKA